MSMKKCVEHVDCPKAAMRSEKSMDTDNSLFFPFFIFDSFNFPPSDPTVPLYVLRGFTDRVFLSSPETVTV